MTVAAAVFLEIHHLTQAPPQTMQVLNSNDRLNTYTLQVPIPCARDEFVLELAKSKPDAIMNRLSRSLLVKMKL